MTKVGTFFSIFLVLSLGLVACKPEVLKTNEKIPRKLVIRKDATPLYNSTGLDTSIKQAEQWQIFFIYENKKNNYNGYYKIGSNIAQEQQFYYVKEKDVIEWNSYFCLAYKNSPDQARREPIKIYETLESLNKQGENWVVKEKPSHSSNFDINKNCQPVLETKDKKSNTPVYLVASLGDDWDETCNCYVSRGNYGIGYVKYSPEGHRYYRYVKREDLERQLINIGEAERINERNMKPDALDKLNQLISSVFSNSDGTSLAKGVEDLVKMLSGDHIPLEPGKGSALFKEDNLRGRNPEELDKGLLHMYEDMRSYFYNKGNWNKDGYAFIPVEWMRED